MLDDGHMGHNPGVARYGSARRALGLAATVGYLVLVGSWLSGNHVWPMSSLSDAERGLVVGVFGPFVVGMIVARWWAILLPLASVPLAWILLTADLAVDNSDLTPVMAALLIAVLLGVPASCVGVLS